ncbi:uncharacterized protein LOC134216438 [Armigeres subalbatus]|uniref:uncharacterized protein LOC134216438 n=1 Tax=Armigeres subalbatus TaxID=124917 RepID=UPI002ED5B8D5
MPETRASEIEALKAELEQLRILLTVGSSSKFSIPDPIKNLSEFTGNKKELSSWLREVDELYEMFKIKGANGQPDSISSMYLRAIKNKIKGDARAVVCANGDPDTISGIKQVLLEQYGDHRDFATNVSALFNINRKDKTHLKFYNECKEINTRLKANLSSNPISEKQIIDILSVAKYLDNIGEPLASIIRQSKPQSLEEAYEAVCINQNAEIRSKPFKFHSQSKPQSQPGSSGSNNNNNYYGKTNANGNKFAYRKVHHSKPRAEHNNNEVDVDISDDEENDENVNAVQSDDSNFYDDREQETTT